MRYTAVGLASVVFFAATPLAAGPLQQPNGIAIPATLQQSGCFGGAPDGLAATFACLCKEPSTCNIGNSCGGSQSGSSCGQPTTCDLGHNGTCETTVWHLPNDNGCIPSCLAGLDPVADAEDKPETFHPSCPLTFDLVTRGHALFKNVFGWYNVTGQKPLPSDLHVMQDCNAQAGSSVVLDLLNEPAWTGGDIGFFLITPESHAPKGTCAGSNCCASVARRYPGGGDGSNGEGYTYFTERSYNDDPLNGQSFFHALIYQSKVWPQKFYFAWEDTYQSNSKNFTDFVSGVSGIHCSGGGAPCQTGKKGACAEGITLCKQAVLTCVNILEASAEQCNGLDDDCDGQVDNGAPCPAGESCVHGACVKPCGGAEFPCAGDTVCEETSGLCMNPLCKAVTCPSGQVCRHDGTCHAPCESVVCPHGQECVNDQCLDLCKGVGCAPGQTCRRGHCFAGCNACDGLACDAPLKCSGATGQCSDPSCPTDCPTGTICMKGQCQDPCTGAVCPSGQFCQSGSCTWAGAGAGGSDGGIHISTGGGSGTSSTSSTSGSGTGGAGEGGSSHVDGGTSAGCACAAGVERTRNATAALLGLGWLRRRRAGRCDTKRAARDAVPGRRATR